MDPTDLDPIEQRSPELIRLRDKLSRLDAWLIDHDDEAGTELWLHRKDVWLSTERRYRRIYDREEREAAVIHAEQRERLL